MPDSLSSHIAPVLQGIIGDTSAAPFPGWNTAAAQANPTPAHQHWNNAQQARNMLGQNWYQQASAAQQQHHQAALQNQQWQAMQQAMTRHKKEWMIDGQAMSFEEFVDTLCPDPEDPMRSFLILKYKK